MADAIAAFKKALREAAAKDLRRIGRWLITLANRLAQDEQVRRMMAECGEIRYGTSVGWAQPAQGGGRCRLPRGHDEDHDFR